MEEEKLVPMEEAKSQFKKLGWALFTLAVVTTLLQVLIGFVGGVLYAMGTDIISNSWFMLGASFVPLYLVGVPACLLVLRKIPVTAGPESRLGGGNFWALLLVCFPVMYIGNLIGTFLSSLLSGGTAQNGLDTLLSNNNPLTLVIVVVLAPLVEEYVFRKKLLDRCWQYGEKTAMVFSALTFALFHMNLFQFFYAFGMGLVFAYVYLRTRRLRYSVLLHMAVNFVGSAVPMWVMSQVDLETLSNLNPQTIDQETLAAVLPGAMLYVGYLLLLLVLVIVGLVVGLVKRKSFTLQPAPEELPREGRGKTVYGNVGFILFAVLCVVVFAISL